MKEAVFPSFGEHRFLVSFLQAQPAAEALLLFAAIAVGASLSWLSLR